MRFIVKVLKGALIGVSIIVPGLSGGSIAMSMGIYEQLLDLVAVSGGTGQKAKVLMPYGIGAVLGIAVFSFIMEWLFLRYPLQTVFLFSGLILGALPMIIRNVKGTKLKLSHIILIISASLIVILMSVMSGDIAGAKQLTPSFPHAMLAFFLGFVAAATMIMPGISGSTLLILLRYFETVLQSLNGFVLALLSFNIAALLKSSLIIIPFTVGAILGVIFMARVLRALFSRFPYSTNYAIIGLVASSPFALIYGQKFSDVNIGGYIILAILLALGYFIGIKLGTNKE